MHKDSGTKPIKFSIIRVYSSDIMSGPEGIFSEIVSSFYYEAYPGREWARIYFEDWGKLTLTHDFLNLPQDERTNIFNLLRNALVTDSNSFPFVLDNLLVAGTEGRVHRLGQDYVVKSVAYRSYRDENDYWEKRLIYMSMFRDMVHAEFPEWVDVVPNLLLYEDSEMNNFVVMPRIGEGITIRDLIWYANGRRLREDNLYAAIQSEFPGFDEDKLIELNYQSWLLDQEIDHLYLRHPELRELPDYRSVNLLVTKKAIGTKGYPYRIWFIDQ